MAKSLTDRLKSKNRSFNAANAQSAELAKAVNSVDGDGIYEDVPLDKIRRDPNQPRPLSEVMAGIDEFADRLEAEKFNLIHPISLAKFSDGSYQVIAGERRYTAFLKKGRATIPAKVYPIVGNEVDRSLVWRVQYSENNDRKDLSCFSTGAALIEGVSLLFGGDIPSDEDCRKHFGYSKRAVYSYTQTVKTPDDVKEFCIGASITDYKSVNKLASYRKKISDSEFEKFAQSYLSKSSENPIHVLEFLNSYLWAESVKGDDAVAKPEVFSPKTAPPIGAIGGENNDVVHDDNRSAMDAKEVKIKPTPNVNNADIGEAFSKFKADFNALSKMARMLTLMSSVDDAVAQSVLKQIAAVEADLKDFRISVEELSRG